MHGINAFLTRLPDLLRERFNSLTSPAAIQAYLDELPYIAEEMDRSPLRMMTDRQGHCLDGGIFGALALSNLGYKPLILDLVPAPGLDDDHVLALYSVNGHWGCVAKSNYPVLRSREPVYHSLRELAMSYFDFFFNAERVRSLRGYTRPLDLSRYPSHWMWDEIGIARITKDLYQRHPIDLISPESISILSVADDRTYNAASLGTDFNWIYGVRKNK